MEKEIVNRVAQSPLVTLDLEELYVHGERVLYDIKENLFENIILKEKDFRDFLDANDWSIYKDKHVAIHCSVDAIIPRWAFMLLAVKLEPYAKTIVYGDLTTLETQLFIHAIHSIDFTQYNGKKVVIKGCSKLEVPTSAYVELTRLLKPFADSIMYGEPCSTVPVYKKKKVDSHPFQSTIPNFKFKIFSLNSTPIFFIFSPDFIPFLIVYHVQFLIVKK